MSRRWVSSGAVALALVPVLAGCGSTKKLDTSLTEKAIAISIAQQRHEIAIVACPKDVEQKADVVFRCAAIEKTGRRTAFRVTQKDDKGNVHYEAVR
jgi:nitrogen regulatory protein PII